MAEGNDRLWNIYRSTYKELILEWLEFVDDVVDDLEAGMKSKIESIILKWRDRGPTAQLAVFEKPKTSNMMWSSFILKETVAGI